MINVQANLSGRNFFKDSGLPLKVLMPDYSVRVDKWHRHDGFYELVVVCTGSACLETRSERKPVHSGHIYLFPDQTVHRYTEIKNFRHYNVLFHPSLLNIGGSGKLSLENLPGYENLFGFQYAGEERCSKLNSVDEPTLARLVSILETLRNETTLWLPGWRESTYFEFMRMMVLLLRACVPADPASSQNIFQISRIIRLMEEDCTKNYSLKQLAELVNMSPSCFRHNFTEITGTPPGEYLINLRLRKALLLLNFPNSVTETARLSGFSDGNYFSRLIRKRTGYAPMEIRKKYLSGELTAETLLDRLESK